MAAQLLQLDLQQKQVLHLKLNSEEPMYEEWKPLYTALLADVMDALGHRDQIMEHTVRPATTDSWFAGPAVTLNGFEANEAPPDPYGVIFASYDVMKAGDVVVIATNGELKSGLWGELLATAAQTRGSIGVVTDGLVRDVRQLNEMGFGCFSKGPSPLDSAGRCQVTEHSVPITCGGVQIQPGDLIVGDYDGVAVVPTDMMEEVYRLSSEKLEGENTVREELAAGVSPREVFDKYGIL
jgi:4-hydroxy-4-methyl-2-oxoglutarate aldolase